MSTFVGIAGGLIAARLVRATDDRTIQLAISLVTAYGTYQLADAIGLSGILATVIAGIVLGSRMRRTAGSDLLVREIEDLWEVVAFILTSLVLLLIGFAIRPPAIVAAGAAVAVGTGAVVAARALIVYMPAVAVRLWNPERALPRGWTHVIFWSGLRGAIALAAALSLPTEFPEREVIQQVSLGVVLVTLVVQADPAPTVPWRSFTGALIPTAVRTPRGKLGRTNRRDNRRQCPIDVCPRLRPPPPRERP